MGSTLRTIRERHRGAVEMGLCWVPGEDDESAESEGDYRRGFHTDRLT